ncbi:hypothetical protein [Sanguibacter suaedae]|uniref:Uncharacterized protein n=1 Tax=Sanguibacter suaedae TaxID=2795737 RepID=A0A934I843_9MICO|nr:hypothetical protein [Sanguibacter suaedae]MBI9113737.1 hypothetical protein [Sanguibacter suaedae]
MPTLVEVVTSIDAVPDVVLRLGLGDEVTLRALRHEHLFHDLGDGGTQVTGLRVSAP